MGYQAEYDTYSNYNRFENLDGIEAKLAKHLISSNSKHAQNVWKLLKYGSLDALSKDNLTEEQKYDLLCTDSGDKDQKRLFINPLPGDAWPEQCSFICIYTGDIAPVDHMRAVVDVTVDIVTHSSVAIVNGDYDISDPHANPNDSNEVSDQEGSIVVAFKNRETVLLKSILAELNGLYLDGIGYLQLNSRQKLGLSSAPVGTEIDFVSTQKHSRHTIHFSMEVSGVSENSDIGF